MNNSRLSKSQHIHCIGIGGIGISALARWLRSEGRQVSGSDAQDSTNIVQLRNEGIHVTIGENLLPEETEAVIYSPAIPVTHPERSAAAQKNIPILSYPEALAEMSLGYTTIAVAGTHGKTSTTAFLGLLLEAAGLDPVVVVGSRVENWQSNFRPGHGKYLVLEADEFNRSLLHYHPHISLITSIELDHVDTYRNLDDVIETFTQFLAQTTGDIFLHIDDAGIQQLPVKLRERAHAFGISLHGEHLQLRHGVQGSAFTLDKVGTVHLPIPGIHMVSNALGAIAVAQKLGVAGQAIQLGFQRLQGIDRRFEHLGKYHNALAISDYAHHPTEVRATLDAARAAYPDAKILAVFQPHQQARLNAFGPDFSRALQKADKVILYHTYEVLGREKSGQEKYSLNEMSASLSAASIPVSVSNNAEELAQQLEKSSDHNTLLLFLGAGSIHYEAKKILNAHRT